MNRGDKQRLTFITPWECFTKMNADEPYCKECGCYEQCIQWASNGKEESNEQNTI